MSDCDYIARPDGNLQSVAIDGVELKATALAIDAESLQRYMRIIGKMPIYDPRIDAALKRAEVTLAAALLAVRITQEKIKKHRG